MFKGTVFDFTYPKKLPNSTIKHEYLDFAKNIKYKRVNIITGPNACGKTAFAKTLCGISNYINRNAAFLSESISGKDTLASFSIIFVTTTDNTLRKLDVSMDADGIVEETYNYIGLRETDTYAKAIERLTKSKDNRHYFHRENDNGGIIAPGHRSVALSKDSIELGGWNYMFSEFNNKTPKDFGFGSDPDLLLAVLQTFDPSIIKYESIQSEAKDEQHSLRFVFSNGDSAYVKQGKLQDGMEIDRFSRGTIDAFEIVNFMDWVINNKAGTFFLDERMAFVHSELETAILNFIIQKLGRDAQLFYTTHNYDVLDMKFPTHSYTFLRKDSFTEAIHPEKIGFTKNDRNLLGYVKNDIFGTIPSTDALHKFL